MSRAKEQYREYQRLGKEGVPFYMCPYTDLIAWKGQEEADKIVSYYKQGYLMTVPCVADGVLILSEKKYKDESK